MQSVEDCWKKCPKPKKDGTSTGCSCTRTKKKGKGDAERWTCVTRVIIDEEFGGGSGGGCGGGSGEEDPDDDGELEDCRNTPVIAVHLKCNSHVERGQKIKCEVKPLDPKYDTDETQYEWSAECNSGFGIDTNQCHATKEETGEAPSKWSGKATMGATITVKVLHQTGESELVTGSGRVTVGVIPRRGWTPNRKPMYATARPKKTLGAPYGPKSYGGYFNGWREFPANIGYSTKSGSGPWEGTVYLRKMPVLNERDKIYLHPDLYPEGEAYPDARKKCDGKKPTRNLLNLVAMNTECDTSDVLERWRDYVREHELAHQASYDKCVRSETIRRLAEDFEGVAASTGNMERAVRDARTKIYDKVDLATEGTQSWNTPAGMWQYRAEDTWRQIGQGRRSHGGTDGCS